MRRWLALMVIVAMCVLPASSATAGLLCHPPKPSKMNKPPHCPGKKAVQPGESYEGKCDSRGCKHCGK